MVQNYLREINKTKIIIIFFIVFSAVAAYAATELSKMMRPMTLEEYERYDGRRPIQPPALFDAVNQFFVK